MTSSCISRSRTISAQPSSKARPMLANGWHLCRSCWQRVGARLSMHLRRSFTEPRAASRIKPRTLLNLPARMPEQSLLASAKFWLEAALWRVSPTSMGTVWPQQYLKRHPSPDSGRGAAHGAQSQSSVRDYLWIEDLAEALVALASSAAAAFGTSAQARELPCCSWRTPHSTSLNKRIARSPRPQIASFPRPSFSI